MLMLTLQKLLLQMIKMMQKTLLLETLHLKRKRPKRLLKVLRSQKRKKLRLRSPKQMNPKLKNRKLTKRNLMPNLTLLNRKVNLKPKSLIQSPIQRLEKNLQRLPPISEYTSSRRRRQEQGLNVILSLEFI